MKYKKNIILMGVITVILVIIAIAMTLLMPMKETTQETPIISKGKVVFLPLPRIKGNMSVEEALAYRRSIREYKKEPLTLFQLSQLLWAAQGISETRWGFRTCPSAGATYPLEVYVVVGDNGVKGLQAGVYHYAPHSHTLTLVKEGDFRKELYKAGLNQPWILNAPVNLVIVAEYERTTRRYGERGIRYVHMEVGHAGQNVYLEATALGLGTVVIGAFYDDQVREVISAPRNQHPLYIIPVGVPMKKYRISESQLWEYIQKNREKLE